MEPWARDAPVDLQPTHLPSLLFNNLASSRGLLCYAHDSQVTLLDTRGTNNKRTLQLRTKVLSSIFVDHETLVVGAAGYVEIWQVPSPSKARLVKRHSLGDFADDDATQSFCRGSALVQGVIHVGCSTGDILRFDGDQTRHPLKGHRAPITCLASSSKLVSGCDRGEIRLWEGDESFVVEDGTRAADIGGDPCASIAVYDDTIIAGFASGRVRSYSEKGDVLHDLQAHARCLTALAIQGDRLATAGEDAHVFVWALPSLEMVHASHVTDSLLTGVAFIDERSLACSAYDVGAVTVLGRGT
mmetsp:Transcript_23442/g.61202  ORF Transcript_23442/g.61202 Transcript_23442/m.61202 type:complete len:300 (-) Transcript_23442:25-924(-)